MVEGTEQVNSALDIFVKDMGLVVGAARDSTYPAPVGAGHGVGGAVEPEVGRGSGTDDEERKSLRRGFPTYRRLGAADGEDVSADRGTEGEADRAGRRPGQGQQTPEPETPAGGRRHGADCGSPDEVAGKCCHA